MKNQPRVIAIYGSAFLEAVHRPFWGINRYCNEVCGFVTRDLRTNSTQEDEPLTPPWKGRCDGVIVSVGLPHNTTDAKLADWVLSGGVPAVSTSSDWSDSRVASMHTDQRALARMAAHHLRDCGCRSFLYVGFTNSAGSQERACEFRAALAGRNGKVVEYSSQLRVIGTMDEETLVRHEKGLFEALKRMPKPLGVWAVNDYHAAAVCLACQHLGLAIPRDAKVLGTDDIAVARTNMPSISSIRTAGEQIGYLAMKALHRILDGKRASGTKVSPEGLVVRDSTVLGQNGLATLEAAVAYIDRHACAGVTVDQCADMLGISKRTFVAEFRRHFGHSPAQEIQNVRLKHATDILRKSSIPVRRIAAMTGFADAAAFSKFITNKTGMSPRAHRRKGQGGRTTHGRTR